jgi:hypothetical protein
MSVRWDNCGVVAVAVVGGFEVLGIILFCEWEWCEVLET